jgi:hypothetical protein
MKSQRELSIIGACGGYSKTSAKHAPVVGNSVLNLLINILGSGSFPAYLLKRTGNFPHIGLLAEYLSGRGQT